MDVRQPLQEAVTAILTAVVDVDDLVWTPEFDELALELLMKLRDVLDLVIDGNDNGQHQATPSHGIRRSIRQAASARQPTVGRDHVTTAGGCRCFTRSVKGRRVTR